MKRILILPVAFAALLAGGATRIVQDQCGPFTDVTPAFCPYILELYYLGITAGTSATTFSPDDPLTRGQGAVFIAKGLNQSLARSSRRAALGRWWTTQTVDAMQTINLPPGSQVPASDGTDIWIPTDGFIVRVRASDGRVLESWTNASLSVQALVAMGRVFATGPVNPGRLYMLDPSQPAADVTLAAVDLGAGSQGLAFDGSRIWTANNSGSVSIVTPGPTLPWSTTTVTGFYIPRGILWDGSSIWVTDSFEDTLLRLDANGAVMQTVPVGVHPYYMCFDGQNIWVANSVSSTVSVVNAATGSLVATLTGNGLHQPISVAFDGQRILVPNNLGPNASVSLWRSADLSPLGTVPMGTHIPYAAASDGVDFWITLQDVGGLVRF